MNNPAENLEGLTIEGGWKVGPLLTRGEKATGGFFSKGYIVSKDDNQCFLKALDISSAFGEDDPARALEGMVRAFNFERDLLAKCEEKRLSRIIRAIGHGKVTVPPGGGVNTVQYILFELAKGGDIRKQIDSLEEFDVAWALRTIHQIAAGMWQLHGIGVAHQDLKPSNVLFVDSESAKVGDLGRSSLKGTESPSDGWAIVGDCGYAPPELLYKQCSSDWGQRRLACDLYLLGSMIVFLFTRQSMTALTQSYLEQSHRWLAWPGTYQEVLPYVRTAYNEAIAAFSKELALEADLASRLVTTARRLCDPEPHLRGNPIDLKGIGNPHSLERFVSEFDLIAKRYEKKLGFY